MAPQDKFVNGFHSISGITISERRKDLYKLLNDLKKDQNEIDVSSIQPKTALEEVFKVECLIFFRKIDQMLNILYGEDAVLIQRVLNAGSWFLNDAFEGMSGEDLVNNIFPKISYNTKLKLLNKLEKVLQNCQQSDDYFQAVKENYGLLLASHLLASCSKNVILKYLSEYKIEVTCHQLLMIVKRYPEITKEILELLEKQNYKISISTKYENVFAHIAEINGALFFELSQKYNSYVSFGKRKTKTFCSQNKDFIIKNSKAVHEILNLRELYTVIKDDYEEYYFNLLPKTFSQFKVNFCNYVNNDKSLPLSKQYYILTNSFKKLYGSDIWDFPSLVTLDLLEMMTPDDREIWMQNHTKPKKIEEIEWISLLKPDKSIPLLMEKISYTSNVQNRKQLIQALVSTCRYNNYDLNALLLVIKYVAEKHRNDVDVLRSDFLHEIQTSYKDRTKFNLNKLTESHWKYLFKFIQNLVADRDMAFWYIEVFIEPFVYFNYLHNQDIRQLILELVKLTKGSAITKVNGNNPNVIKNFLGIVAEGIPEIFKKEEDLKESYSLYLYAISEYNVRHPKNKMSFFENLNAIEYLQTTLSSSSHNNYFAELVISKIIKMEFEKSLQYGVVEAYFKSKSNERLRYEPTFKNVLEKDPEYFLKTALPVLENFNTLPYELHFLKYYEHLDLPQTFTRSYITSENTILEADSLNPNRIKCLAHTMKPNDFVSLVSSYYPQDLVANCEDEAGKEIYKLQKAITQSLSGLSSVEEALNSLLHFCKGDYLKFSVGSLQSLCRKLNESKVMKFIDLLNTRAVSVRKHSIYLTYDNLKRAVIYNFLNQLLEKENNKTIKKAMLKATFKQYLNNQDQHDFELVKEILKGVDLRDSEAITMLSKKVQNEYILFIWDVLESIESPDDAVRDGKCRILKSINDSNIASLPEEFCVRLINNYLFKSAENQNYFESNIEAFAITYILHFKLNDEDDRIKAVLSIVNDFVRSNWCNIETYTTGRKFITKFITQFCDHFLSKKGKNFSLLKSFLKMWEGLFEPFEVYNEYLHLNFTLIYANSVKESLSMYDIGKAFREFSDDLDCKGLLNFNLFSEGFKYFKSKFESIYENEEESESLLAMAEGALAGNDTLTKYMLAVCFLPDIETIAPTKKDRYSKIFNQIIKQKSPAFQIFFHNYCLSMCIM